MSEPYYRISFCSRKIHIAQISPYEEDDYNNANWLSAKKFDTQKEAVKFLRDKMNDENVPEIIRIAISDFFRTEEALWENCLDSDSDKE